nr:MAG TPA: hypothetical protein [Caudoviricetes sp.]
MNQYDTMTITEEQAKRYKFPAKAVGYWAIIEETEEQMVLHRLTKSGQLGSDRPNNILKVKKLDIAEIFKSEKSQDEKVLTAKASDGKEVVIVRSRTVDISDNAEEPKIESSPEENIKIDDSTPDNDWRSFNIGTRKSRWIAQLIEKMKSEPFTGQFIEKVGEKKFVEQVLRDTNSERRGGKVYSSIETAMTTWNSRVLKGFDYAE